MGHGGGRWGGLPEYQVHSQDVDEWAQLRRPVFDLSWFAFVLFLSELFLVLIL